jgi:hypothetical protein
MRKPDPMPDSCGIVVSSAYVNDETATSASENRIHAANGLSDGDIGESVPMTSPLSLVKLCTKPLNFAVRATSDDTKYATTGKLSVTNLCKTSPASLGEIALSFMA